MFDAKEPVLEKVFPSPIKGPICKNLQELSNLILNSWKTDTECRAHFYCDYCR